MPPRAAADLAECYLGNTEIVATVKEIAWGLRGYRITYEPPVLRHFTARFEPLASDRCLVRSA